jgi:hypothetical protein
MRRFRSASLVAVIWITLPAVTVPASLAQPATDLTGRFDDAERRIVRLSPTAFPDLPRNLSVNSYAAAVPFPKTRSRKSFTTSSGARSPNPAKRTGPSCAR